MRRASVLGLVALALSAAGASANTFGSAPSGGYTPRVPISALAQPMAAFDPSRLHFSTSVSMGTAFGGGTTGLQVTSLTYQFQAPVTMRVSLGNAWGKGIAQGSSFFLEGVDLSFRPSANTFFQFSYQDRRSPLQYGPSPYYAPYYAPDWYR